MTVSYSGRLHTANNFRNFYKLFKRWKGSVFQLIWKKLIIYLCIYYFISLLYRYVLVDYPIYKGLFENLCVVCEEGCGNIPLNFMLGFYVNIVISRWWSQFECFSWPDTLALKLATLIPHHVVHPNIANPIDHQQKKLYQIRNLKRNSVRQAIASFVLVLRTISSQVHKRFPTLHHLHVAKLITKQEYDRLSSMDSQHDLHWMTLNWAMKSVSKINDFRIFEVYLGFRDSLTELTKIHTNNRSLFCYGWIPIPLVYTQVVTLCVYSYFASLLFSSQFIDPSKDVIHEKLISTTAYRSDYYFPIFAFIQFIFYMGWLNVAEVLLNPFGEDEDDFETNYLIDRNLQVAMMIIEDQDLEYEDCPFLKEGIIIPENLPNASKSKKSHCKNPTNDSNKNEPMELTNLVVNNPVVSSPPSSSQQIFSRIRSLFGYEQKK